VTEDEVRALVKGQTAAEAEALLAEYGTLEVVLWPDWVSTITSLDARLDVVVVSVPPADATPSPSPRPAPTAAPATAPSATAAPSVSATP
jgi:hypothetical protein